MGIRFKRLNEDMTCSSEIFEPAAVKATDVSAPVGIGCPNRREDVLLVQRLLNRVPPAHGGPVPPLVEDGIVGPLTSGAIWRFQRTQFGWADGRVDPGQKTIYTLVGVAETPAAKPNLAPEAERAIPDALHFISNARRHLGIARLAYDKDMGGTDGLFGPLHAAAKAILDRHFHVDKWWAPLDAIREIDLVYCNMMVAIGHIPAGLWIFEDDPSVPPAPAFAFTYAGGYLYLRGRSGEAPLGPARIFYDRIYLCRRLVRYDHDTIVYAVIHELAHYVGGEDGTAGMIDDYAYSHRDPSYVHLPPQRALRNADCYSQYAWEVTRHGPFRPYAHRS